MMKIAVLTDVHANLPALQAALNAIHKEGCDAVYHTGDAIAIGPYPAECLDLLLNTPQMHPVMGNHDAWFAYGLPQPQPPWMSDGELEHQHWVHSCLDPSLRAVVRKWPYFIEERIDGVQARFVHYALDESGRDFAPIVREPAPADLDCLFEDCHSEILFYGHQHSAADVPGKARYVNPGSMGCHREPLARFVVFECEKGKYELKKYAVPYDDTALLREFEKRKVPERDFILRVFFGGRRP